MQLAVYVANQIRILLMDVNSQRSRRNEVPVELFQAMTAFAALGYILCNDRCDPLRFPVMHAFVRSMTALMTQLMGAQLLDEAAYLQQQPMCDWDVASAEATVDDLDEELRTWVPWFAGVLCHSNITDGLAGDRALETLSHSLAPLVEKLNSKPLLKIFNASIEVRPLVVAYQSRPIHSSIVHGLLTAAEPADPDQ